MIPTRAFQRLAVCICGITLVLLFSISSSQAQCTPPDPPTFSATAGPYYQEITLDISAINPRAYIEKLVGRTWEHYAEVHEETSLLEDGLLHNETVHFRARNVINEFCFSSWVNASATTFDVGNPWIYIYTGFESAVVVASGPISPPGICSTAQYSLDGVNFQAVAINGQPWCVNTEQVFPMVANVTYYFRSVAHAGLNPPRYSPVKMARIALDQDYGRPSCEVSVGRPVNVTNGNMFLDQSDYRLPGIGETIDVTRSYNSAVQTSGLFGFGWTTILDQNLTLIDSKNIRIGTADGRANYFARATPAEPFKGLTPGYDDAIVVNGDGTYTLTYTDGRSANFKSSGKLSWLKDRNGNQTNLNYNGSNTLIGVVDAFGRTLTITVSGGLVSQISDSLGTIATYAYFPSTSLLKTVTYQDGSKFEFEYDSTSAPGKTLLKTVKDASNNVLETHLYDSQGRATTSEIHGAHEKYTLDYSNSAFTNVTDGLGRVTKYHFDRSGIRTVIKKIEGFCGCGGSGTETTEFFHDAELNLVKKVDALGRETLYTYDNNRNLLSQEEKIGQNSLGTETFTYNTFRQVLTHTDRMNGLRTNTYDANGNLLTTKDPLNNITTLEYPTTNNKGLPTQIKDARNNITKFKWFANSGLLEEIEDPYGKKTNFTYDARGRTNTITNPLGHVTDYNYFDDTQRKVEMIYPNLDKITYKYDIRRLLESITDERGKVTSYEFDPQYRLKKITDPLGHAREFGYNAMSFMTSSKDGLGNVTNYVPDDFDRLKEVEYPAPTVGAPRLKEKFEYDKVGRIKKVTDTANRDTVYTYDDTNRKITVTNAEFESTELKYNARFQNIEVKDALNQVYTFTYDPLDRMLSQTRAGATMSFEYDAVGNRQKRTDYAGRVTHYEYDNLNRLKKIKYGDPVTPGTPVQEATYNYDDISRLVSAINGSGTVSFAYDNRDRVTSTTDVFNRVVAYEYERTSTVNQKRLRLDGALYATYNYDNAERLSNIVNASDSTTITFGYDNADRNDIAGLPERRHDHLRIRRHEPS